MYTYERYLIMVSFLIYSKMSKSSFSHNCPKLDNRVFRHFCRQIIFSTTGELCIYTFFIVYLCNMYHMLIYVLFSQTKNGLNAVLSLNHRSNLCVIFVLFCLKYHAI